jgi:L-2-hydroxyglutarate oxidase
MTAQESKSRPTINSVIVVGGGLIGLATAYRLLQRGVAREVTVLEKEPTVAAHQSSHNSGVLHAGLYYQPGTLKAQLAVTGIRAMTEYCRDRNVAHEICGKLVVAVDNGELARLADLEQRGMANGLRGVRRLGPDEAREMEPNVRCVAALHVPEEGIADYPAVARALVADITQLGGIVRTSAAVTALRRERDSWRAITPAGEFTAQVLVTCAGLHSDRVAALAGITRGARIVPFRGEYYSVRAERQNLVRNLVYPVPDPAFPFLGVHFTRMIAGGLECGPNAVLALRREGYRWRDVSVRDTADVLLFPGMWRFLRRYPSMAFGEVWRSLSRAAFLRSLQRLVPSLEMDDLRPGGSGVRAQGVAADGSLIHDFVIERAQGAVHVINAPSPGATASLSIGDYVVGEVQRLA